MSFLSPPDPLSNRLDVAPFELGISSFAELTPDPSTGKTVSPAQRLADLLEEIELADQVGLDVYGLGEHHRPDFVASAPAVILAAAAARTKRIRLSSAVTVLSSDDPVRVFQQFATLDLLSGGRAEIIAGRGSFIESFPLFGYDLQDYDSLFAEKLELLLKLRGGERITWSGRHRPALDGVGVYPRPVQAELPVWVGVGGTPASAIRAAQLGLPLVLAIIGGSLERFVPFADLYRDVLGQGGRPNLPIGIHSHGYIADTGSKAVSEFYGPYAFMMSQIGRERGWSGMSRAQFDALRGPGGALFVGTPDEVAEKILYQHALFGHTRFVMHPSVGTLPHAGVMRAIELLGTEVAPVVRAEVARRNAGREAVPADAEIEVAGSR